MGYLLKSRRLPRRPLHCNLALTTKKIFSDLNTHISKIPLRERVRWDWISEDTRVSIDARVTARREGPQQTVRRLIQRIRAVLNTDRRRKAEMAGSTIESLLASDPPLYERYGSGCGGGTNMWPRDPPPARISLETLTTERAELYAHVPPPGRPIPIKVSLFPVDITIPG